MRLEHLLSRALVLAVMHAGERRRKGLLVSKLKDYITLAVNLKNKRRTARNKNEECLVAQLVRVLH